MQRGFLCHICVSTRCQLAGKVFTHKCDTENLSALIQCWNIVQQIERDCFSVAKHRSIYTTLAFLALLGAPYIYDISSLRVKSCINFMWVYGVSIKCCKILQICLNFLHVGKIYFHTFAHKENLILKSSYFWFLRVLANMWKATIS